MFRFFLILILQISLNCFAQLRPNYSTRLLSTSGSGVASILVNESVFLNPASIAFFDTTNFYIQNDKSEITNENSRKSDETSNNNYLLLSDTSSDLKGALSYQEKSEFDLKNKKFVATGAGLLAGDSAIGFSYSYNQTEFENKNELKHILTSGITYIKNEELSFGILLTDLTKEIKENAKIVTGFQYKILPILTFIFDVETNYYLDSSEYSGYRTALQSQFYDDFFLRIGKFDDGFLEQNGQSWGLSWYGPRLSLEYAYVHSKQKMDFGPFLKEDIIVDQSLSLSVRF
jgi:hypothetical protein